MKRSDLDLRFSVFESTTACISTLLLYTHLRARPRRPRESPPEYLVLYREESACAPGWITTSVVTDQDVLRLETLLVAAGFPRRIPRVAPNTSLLGGQRFVVLEVKMRGRSVSLNLTLEHAGFSGEDAGPLRAVLHRLAVMAPPDRQPAVQSVMDHLVFDRRHLACLGPARDGLVAHGPVWRRRFAVDVPEGPAFWAGARDGGSRPASPSSEELLTDP